MMQKKVHYIDIPKVLNYTVYTDHLNHYADYVLEKHTPSSFFNTELSKTLDDLGVNHLFITGINTEFCCMFTAIVAFDRGYKVTFIKNATG
ncbi:isochorismatase family cysteine hydrolase [Cytobacillus sp. IB215665]|nr:isochorismatase family cysteine hydrolase [Cytobacillus sp. IB215665]MDX8363590.1 isochorismatase family cysteine hydrolase [Cytobacillus sp. IB215665]